MNRTLDDLDDKDRTDLGSGHSIMIAVWDPDLELNPDCVKYKDNLPLKCSGIIRHQLPGVNPGTQGGYCEGVVTFDSPIAREVFSGPFWTVESWNQLTLSPSILCRSCGDHGYIKQGKWVSV